VSPRGPSSKNPRSRSADSSTAALCEDGLMSVIGAADWLSISLSKMYQLLSAGEIPYVRIGADRRIPKRALLEYTNSRLVQRAAR